MAIKINTSFGERLTSGMLNEKIHNITGGNEKLNGFDVVLKTSTSVTITPGKALINGCAIEETSDTQTLAIDEDILSTNGLAYIVINYAHEAKRVLFTCAAELTTTMVKLATLTIKDGVIVEVNNHIPMKTLNSAIGEAAEIEAQKIRDSIPSGFTELGELDYNYMKSHENIVTLKNKSIAYVNGYRVEIPAGTVIDIGEAPEKDAREDFIFLEVWKDSDFSKNGKVKWRIRHVENVNFTKFPYGLNQAQDGGKQDDRIKISKDLLNYEFGTSQDKDYWAQYSRCSDTTNSSDGRYIVNNTDAGLFVAGTNLQKITNTYENWIYAIPMFRVYRRCSIGKVKPFEYKKINPKVDYSKFYALMKEDTVESIVSENIKGRSLNNHMISSGIFSLSIPSSSSSSIQYPLNIIPKDRFVNIKPNTLYTAIVTITKPLPYGYTFEIGSTISRIAYVNAKKSMIANVCSTIVFTFTTLSDLSECNCASRDSVIVPAGYASRGETLEYKYTILEGDWTNKEIPGHFIGLKSLGEDEGNIIEVKNSILNESSYDPNTGNIKLKAKEGINYLGCNNLIEPDIEAQIKRLDTKLSDVTTIDKIDNLVGDEIIEFTKIKGKTLHNLIDYDSSSQPTYTSSSATVDWLIKHNVLKANTEYSIINLTGKRVKCNINKAKSGDYITTKVIEVGATVTFNYPEEVRIHNFNTATYSEWSDSNKDTIKNIVLLEGNYIGKKIPFFRGVQSVGDAENNKIVLRRTGKNLINLKNNFIWDSTKENKGSHFGTELVVMPIKNNESYNFTLDYEKIEGYKDGGYGGVYIYLVDELLDSYSWFVSGTYTSKNLRYKSIGGSERIKGSFEINFTNSESYKYLVVFVGIANGKHTVMKFNNCYLAKAIEGYEYQPFNEYKQEIVLKDPLRSLPNGVCDTIEGNKVIRRVGVKTLNGTEIWSPNNSEATTTKRFIFAGGATNVAVTSGGHETHRYFCDKLVTSAWSQTLELGITVSEPNIFIYNNKLELTSEAIKTWLSQNPVTIYYELKTPIEEPIEPKYDKESIKTYQLDAPLRGLPNGVCDEIKDGVLIRRCGEIVVPPTIEWEVLRPIAEDFDEFLSKDKMFTSDLAIGATNSVNDLTPSNYANFRFVVASNIAYLRIPKSYNINTVELFKKWLNNRYIKIIYPLSTPTETRLKEISANKFNPDLYRQFEQKGNYLLELPNGVKDTVESSKIIRRVGSVTLNSSESWVINGENSKFIELRNDYIKPNSIVLVKDNILPMNNNIIVGNSHNDIGIGIYADGQIRLKPYAKDDMTVEEGKTWLSKNPITILYELRNQIEEILSDDNNKYVPYSEINSYCGGLYVGNGTNDLSVQSAIKTDSVIVDTDFRNIKNKDVITDCKYKKNEDSYELSMLSSSTKNLFDVSSNDLNARGEYVTISKDSSNKYTVNTGSTVQLDWGISTGYKSVNPFQFPSLRKGIKIFCKAEGTFSGIWLSLKNTTTGVRYMKGFANQQSVELVLDEDYMEIEVVFTKSGTNQTYNVYNIMIGYGEAPKSYIPYKSTKKAFTSIDSNDVEDIRHQVSLTGFDYQQVLNKNIDKLFRGEL